MADWQEAVQAGLIALLFALMVAKLVSVVISFRSGNLRVERGRLPPKFLSEEATSEASIFSDSVDFDEDRGLEYKRVRTADVKSLTEQPFLSGDVSSVQKTEEATDPGTALPALLGDKNLNVGDANLTADAERFAEDPANVTPKSTTVVQEGSSSEVGDEETAERVEKICESPGDLSDSDEWEGVETSELDERFDAAVTFVATQSVGSGLKVPNETRLLLYGLYKLATEGPCTSAQPSAYKISARAKWNAWQKLGNVGPEEAMHRYIAMVSDISPGWAQGDEKQADIKRGEAIKESVSGKGGMGPVFSCLARSEEGVAEEGTLESIHVCAREGDQAGLLQQIEDGTPVDVKDSDGRTALHWAADRGHLQAVELLLAKGAQIHAKDAEGQTALHYATTCEHEGIAKYLVANGAEPGMLDNEGVSPMTSCPAHWLWIGQKTP